MHISVVGLGYVGAVSAACLAGKGHLVWGVDINPEKVCVIKEGRSPIVEPGLGERLRDGRDSNLLNATCDIEHALRESDVCFLSVATPSRRNGQIDSSHLLRACKEVAEALFRLGKRQVVVIRSSVLPSIFDGCAEIFASTAPGLVDLCANPEFLREGTAIEDFEQPPFTILGTEDPSVEKVLRSVYAMLPGTVFALKPKEALMVKYASNAFHALKVAFANEIGAICREAGADATSVMDVFCTDTQLNISRRYLMPGYAFGGSCLPKDLRALLFAGREYDLELPLIAGILSSNREVIDRALHNVRATGARQIGMIGLSFKQNTDDLRESPFVNLAEQLLGKGYELRIYDPNVMITKLIGANRAYIDSVIPHLSKLLVSSLEDLAGMDALVVGHHFEGVDAFLSDQNIEVIDLSSYKPRALVDHKALAAAYAH